MSLQTEVKVSNGKGRKAAEVPVPEPQDVCKARLAHRGAKLAFVALSRKFGAELFTVIPKMWDFVAGCLETAYSGGMLSLSAQPVDAKLCITGDPFQADRLIEKKLGQDLIDSLSVLRVAAGTLHEDLWPPLIGLLSKLSLPLRSRFAILRQCTARCFASVCNVVTPQAMKHVVEDVVPYLGDSLSITNRQGATELIYRACFLLDFG